MTSRRRSVDKEPTTRKVQLLTNVRDLGTGKLMRTGEEVSLEEKKARRWEALGYVKMLDMEVMEAEAVVPAETKEEGEVTEDG